MPRWILLPLSFAFAACVAPSSDAPSSPTETASSPIIGGVPSADTDYPSAGVLIVHASFMGQSFDSMICTGTLIAPDVVLTAGHCSIDIFGMFGATSEFYFSFALDVSAFGMGSTAIPPRSTRVKRLMPHPMYDLNQQPPTGLAEGHDVGIAFLETEVTDVVPEIVADALATPFIVQGSTVSIAGYGQRAQDGMEAGVKYHAPSILNELGTHEMQIGDAAPVPQKCHGDSGGPTYFNVLDGRFPAQRVIGITSRAYDESDCLKGGVDMRADAYWDWLNTAMIDACNDGTRGANACAGGGGLPVAGGTPIDAGVRDSGPTAPDASPPDLGTPDTGGAPDSGVAEDSGAAADSGGGGNADAAAADLGGGGGGGRSEEAGCSCSTAGDGESSRSNGAVFFILAIAAAAIMRARR